MKNRFFIIAIKANDIDDLAGFRFNILGKKGKYVKRKHATRGYKIEHGPCNNMYHLGKRTLYVETKANKSTSRRLRHFAG
jgi:hypothetical protein